MAKRARNTYSNLSLTLRSLGFQSKRQGNHVVFTHSSGRPMILLPAYKSGEAVKPIHLMMIQKQLIDAGMIKPSQPAIGMRHKPAIPNKH